MGILKTKGIAINITGTAKTVIADYLRVFLANERLTEKQLEVTTELVTIYGEYVSAGVVEPYASALLFSTDTRKDVVKALKISPAHLNNTFNALTKKGIMSKKGDKYVINPNLVPTESLTFHFKISD